MLGARAQVWMHESERVYSDRLATRMDQKKYRDLALEQARSAPPPLTRCSPDVSETS